MTHDGGELIVLADVDNFYASCETVFAPSLRGRPLVVLSNNDGCVVSLYFVKLTCTVSSLFLDSFVVHSGRFGLSGFPLVLFGYFISEWVFL